VDDFKSHGNHVIEQLQKFAAKQADWEIVPNNYEGLRVSCTSASESGWFLLRLSLHDPVMPLNVESNVKGGVAQIVDRLLAFFQTTESLDLSALSSR
jgi:phosphomannomutase